MWYHSDVRHASKAPAHAERRVRESDAKRHSMGGYHRNVECAGVQVTQRSGSRVLPTKGAERIVVHRPHPEPETGRATVRDIAAFLDAAGVGP